MSNIDLKKLIEDAVGPRYRQGPRNKVRVEREQLLGEVRPPTTKPAVKRDMVPPPPKVIPKPPRVDLMDERLRIYPLTPEDVLAIAANVMRVTVEDLVGERSAHEFALRREITIAFMSRVFAKPFQPSLNPSQIAALFNRHISIVAYARGRVATRLLNGDATPQYWVAEIFRQCFAPEYVARRAVEMQSAQPE